MTQAFETGARHGADLKIELANSAYVTEDILYRYIDEAAISASISNWGPEGYKDKPAVLLCDNCSAHCSDEGLKKLAQHKILSCLRRSDSHSPNRRAAIRRQ
jgi:hypothetical protein